MQNSYWNAKHEKLVLSPLVPLWSPPWHSFYMHTPPLQVWTGKVNEGIKTVDCHGESTNYAKIVPVCSYVYQPHTEPSHPLLMTFAQIVFVDFPNWWGPRAGDVEPDCLKSVTDLLRRSQFGAIDVHTIPVDFVLDTISKIDSEENGKDNPAAYSMELREQVNCGPTGQCPELSAPADLQPPAHIR